MQRACYTLCMQDILIQPSRGRIILFGGIWWVAFVGLLLLPLIHWSSSSGERIDPMSAMLYLVLLSGFGYATFRLVIRSFFATLAVRADTLVFSSLYEQKEVDISAITDVDFYVKGGRPRGGEDAFFFHRSSDAVVDYWHIGIGWRRQDLMRLVEMVRARLGQQGVKTFPLLESGLYGSARGRSK